MVIVVDLLKSLSAWQAASIIPTKHHDDSITILHSEFDIFHMSIVFLYIFVGGVEWNAPLARMIG